MSMASTEFAASIRFTTIDVTWSGSLLLKSRAPARIRDTWSRSRMLDRTAVSGNVSYTPLRTDELDDDDAFGKLERLDTERGRLRAASRRLRTDGRFMTLIMTRAERGTTFVEGVRANANAGTARRIARKVARRIR